MRVLTEFIQKTKRRGLGIVRDLLYIPKHGKLPEGVFLSRIALSIAVIIGCLGAMGLSAYAYFKASEGMAFGPIQSAGYTLEITANGTPLTDGQLQGEADETYEIVLKKEGTASTGFCAITVQQEGAADVIYHTQQIGADMRLESDGVDEITLTVSFKSAATLIFEPHWGTSSTYSSLGDEVLKEPQDNLYLVNGETLTVAAIPPQGEGTTPQSTSQTQTSVTSASTVTTKASDSTTSTTVASGESTSATVSTSQTEAASSTTSATETSAEATTTETTEANTTPDEQE